MKISCFHLTHAIHGTPFYLHEGKVQVHKHQCVMEQRSVAFACSVFFVFPLLNRPCFSCEEAPSAFSQPI